MPYIDQVRRTEKIDYEGTSASRDDIGVIMGLACDNGGDLQYMLAVAIDTYITRHGLRYQNCQDIMGALAGALHEFQRCVVDPYEEKKIKDNGPVYQPIEDYPSSGY